MYNKKEYKFPEIFYNENLCFVMNFKDYIRFVTFLNER